MRRIRALMVPLALAVAAWPIWHVVVGVPLVRAAVSADMPDAGAPDAGEPPVVVSDEVIATRPWQDSLQAFGQLRAVQGTDLSAPVAGVVGEIDFASGQEVKAGTVVLRLRPYDDDARLAQLQAMVSLWQANLARDSKQFAAQAISRATLDLDDANLRQYQAEADAQRQVIEEKVVRAPFDGRLGIRQVDLGQYLQPGTVTTSLQALDRLYVDFDIVQQEAVHVQPGETVSVGVDAWPGRRFSGRVVALDSRVDPASRMAAVRAELDNRDRALLPGMFAVVHLANGAARPVVTVPQAAVSFAPYGDFVFVLTAQAGYPGRFVATSRLVRPGPAQGDRVMVEHGLAAGERIVTAGGFKLRSGAVVTIDDRVPVADPTDAVAEE